MEARRTLISPPSPSLPRIHPRSPFSASVPKPHDQVIRAVASMQTSSVVHRFPASVLSHEQRDDCRINNFDKEEKTVQAMPAKWHVESGSSCFDDKQKYEYNQYSKELEHRLHDQQKLLDQQGLSYLFPFLCADGKPQLEMSIRQMESDDNVIEDSEKQILVDNISNLMRPADVLALAKRAMIASRKAASFAETTNLLAVEDDVSCLPGWGQQGYDKDILLNEKPTVKSNRLLERRSKKRKASKKPENIVYGVTNSKTKDIIKKKDKALDPNDPLRLFLWGPETKQLLTVKEEKDLFVKIQDLMRLEEVQQTLRLQFDREPTLAELAEAVGMSCHALQSCISSGKRSREKMINANLRLVVHLARQYEGKGLNIQDLLQEGSRGLMKSLEKFKPKAGCRFPTYAYWWIRQSINKAIFQNSRTIRLPENVFGLLKKIKDARRMHMQEGRLPTNEEIAKYIGISVDKLESLLLTCRNPVSIQKCAWVGQDATFQEITADPEVEAPDISISKQMMRHHVRSLLRILDSRERQIIQYRFGVYGREPKTLTEIGMMFNLSKERVRQLESRALNKLKDSLLSQGLQAYVELLT